MTNPEAAGPVAAETEGDEEPRISLARGGSLGFLSGIVIGAAAGLIGVGGGEFRIPVLLHVLRLPVKAAAGANTVIGLFVVVLSVARRWGQQPLTRDDLTLGRRHGRRLHLGAVIGARQAHRLSTPLLKRIVCLYLLAVGVWMVVEGPGRGRAHALRARRAGCAGRSPPSVGFLIAAASGALGVAGGEMRIPALMYLFAMPVKVAGTVSLIASIPTVAAGAFDLPASSGTSRIACSGLSLLMGAGSLIGVLIGAALLPLVETQSPDSTTLPAALTTRGAGSVPHSTWHGSISNEKTRETGTPGGSGSLGGSSAIRRAVAIRSPRSRPSRRSPPSARADSKSEAARRAWVTMPCGCPWRTLTPAAASLISPLSTSAVGPRRPWACQRPSQASWASQ